MPSSDYMGWVEYRNRFPFTVDHFERLETMLALLLTMTANINRDAKVRPIPFELHDFAPWIPKQAEAPDNEIERRIIAAKDEYIRARHVN
jgi:hypothetical protein